MCGIRNFFCSLLLSIFIFGCKDILNEDLTDRKPVAELTADELITALKKDDGFFREEILLVKGALVEFNNKNGNNNLLLKGNTNQNHYIVCEMNPSINVEEFNFSGGQHLVVKGILKGYLNDAVLLNCVLDKIPEP